jgi:hypothetical protein
MDNKKIPFKYYLYFILLIIFFFLILFPYMQTFRWFCRTLEDKSGISISWEDEKSSFLKTDLKNLTITKDTQKWYNFAEVEIKPTLKGLHLLAPQGENYLSLNLNLAGLKLETQNLALPSIAEKVTGSGKITGNFIYEFWAHKLQGDFQAQLNNTPLPLISGTVELKGNLKGDSNGNILTFDASGTNLSGSGSLKLEAKGNSFADYPLSGNAEFQVAGNRLKYNFSGTAGNPAFTPEK